MPGPGKVGDASVSKDSQKLTDQLQKVVEALEWRRLQLQLPERDLCQRAGINRTTFRRAMFKEGEHRGMTLRTFLAMCEAMYVTPSDIMKNAGL